MRDWVRMSNQKDDKPYVVEGEGNATHFMQTNENQNQMGCQLAFLLVNRADDL